MNDDNDYMDYADVVLLASIEVPRCIVDPDELHNLHLLCSQDMTGFGSTMRRGSDGTLYTIPTARLFEYGQVALRYMRSKMNRHKRAKLRAEVKSMRDYAKQTVASL